ncbi:hypothetical protein [Spirosoma sp. KUDC1026]|uniref:hypothetical protein n=1 Tax=Spirosoma sp. KUDC1026 TaxID=2745947 RepID=UPI00159B92E2|nr:hypothetical protein [Spirosoma sp. KUDC1026]QKZ11529.1 hypothetical protein HU175_02310 [Spirosoma sp. KUDC1026]
MNKNSLSIGLLMLGLTACNPERVQYTSELKQEMSDMKIKKISNADLLETINTAGAKISTVMEDELTAALKETADPAKRVQLCQLQNLPKTKAVAERYKLDINLLGAADVKNKALQPKEQQILDAYLYNAEQKLPQTPNIQQIDDTLFIYNQAVPAQSPICEVCFGKQQTPLAVWRLAFHKREVIRHMSASQKKKKSAQ